MLRSLSPMRLLQYGIASGCLLACGFVVDDLPNLFPSTSHLVAWTNLEAVLFLAGFCLAVFAYRSLRQGLQVADWTDAEVDSARAYLSRPGFRWIPLAYILSVLAFIIARKVHGHHLDLFGFAYVAVWPLTWMQVLLRPTPPRTTHNWADSSPIHSDHWGRSGSQS